MAFNTVDKLQLSFIKIYFFGECCEPCHCADVCVCVLVRVHYAVVNSNMVHMAVLLLYNARVQCCGCKAVLWA